MSEKRLLQKVAANDMPSAATWRSGWDSNPRALADNLISSQARYDHFDTAPDGDRAKPHPIPDIIPAAVEKIKQFIQIVG